MAFFGEAKAGQLFLNSPRKGVTGFSGLGAGLFGRVPLSESFLYEAGLEIVRYTSGSQTLVSYSVVPARVVVSF